MTRGSAALLAVRIGALVLCGAPQLGCQPADRVPTAAVIADALPVTPGINVVVLSFDALRARALGTYGADRPTSPRIDAFAKGALVLERAYAAAPTTPISFAAMFSGAHAHRVFRNWIFRPPLALAEAFGRGGYRTAAFLHNVQLARAHGFDRGFETYEVLDPEASDETTLEHAAAWLAEHRRERMFAWIHLITPHAPYQYRADATHLYDAGYEGPFAQEAPPNVVATAPADVRRIRTLYDGEVLHADHLFATLWGALGDLGLADDTLVVLTTDHGEELGEHGSFGHGLLWNEHLHVPLILRHPQVGRGARSAALVSGVDLAPTLAAIAGVDWPPGPDGRSLLDAAHPRTAAVSMSAGSGRAIGAAMRRRGASLRRDDLHLIVSCPLPNTAYPPTAALYDLASDPQEAHDLSHERDDVRRTLEGELWSSLGVADCDALELGDDLSPLQETDRTVEALRALGYVAPKAAGPAESRGDEAPPPTPQ